MKLARLAVGAFITAAIVASAFDADARGSGGRSGGRGGSSHHGSHHHGSHSQGYKHGASSGHTHSLKHGHARWGGGVFFASTFLMWPSAYYWPDYHPLPAGVPVAEYWYYCQPYAAYYPYVQECPTEWQPVLPTIPLPEG
jgi:hypothetical protein